METKIASKGIWKHVVCCFILLIIFMLTIGVHIKSHNNNPTNESTAISDSGSVPLYVETGKLVVELNYESINDEVLFSGPEEMVTDENDDFNSLLSSYADEIKFFSKTFGVKSETIINDLKQRREKNKTEKIEETNLGFLKNTKGNLKKFSSVEYGIVEYFYDYVEKNPKKVNNKRKPYTGKAGYIENLIIYYTTHIYTEVDTSLALSIGSVESGAYTSKKMLKANNIHGGMSSESLKKYKNIEYGVLSYIRLLSKNYYGKGLTTAKTIGKKYCPTFDKNGKKVVSPYWLKYVTKNITKYKKKNFDIYIKDLL